MLTPLTRAFRTALCALWVSVVFGAGASMIGSCSSEDTSGPQPDATDSGRESAEGSVEGSVDALVSSDASDPCLVDHGGCDLLTSCTMVDGGRVCGPCPAPFAGDGEKGCECVSSAAGDGGQMRNDPPPLPDIARGASYTLAPAPNYSYCTEAGDATQLTDGVYTTGHFWTQATTVGWTNETPVITIDLGSVRAVRGLTYNTAALSGAGVRWPDHIFIFTADQDKKFHFAGDLAELHQRHAVLPAVDTFTVHKFWTDELTTHGRYVALVVITSPYAFVDEIEVFEGDPAWISTPLEGEGFDDLKQAADQHVTAASMRLRVVGDMRAIVQEAADKNAPADVRALLSCELDSVTKAAAQLPDPPASLRTELPINALHARVLSDQARLWQALGHSGLEISTSAPTWDRLAWRAEPAATPVPSLKVDLMRQEHRGVRLSIANASLRPQSLALHVRGLVGGDDPPWVSAHPVSWTDTRSLEPVAAALSEATTQIEIASGMTREVWLDVHPQSVEAGTYNGRITIDGLGGTHEVPFTVVVRPWDFPSRPRLHVGGWDYTNGKGAYGVTAANRAAFIAMLRDHYVDTPWATASVWPAGSFDAAGHLTSDPSTSEFDDWLTQWPGVDRFRIFGNVAGTFGGFDAGSAEFATAVTQWAQYWATKVKGHNLKPENFEMHLVDEPSKAAQDAVIVAWGQAIRASGTGFGVWEDVVWDDPMKADPAMIAVCDTLCPNRQMFLKGDEAFRSFFRQQRQAGKTLEFYSCEGPARLLDKYAYYRLQAWTAWKEGAEAMNFWSFGDNNSTTSWNEYLVSRAAFTPLFLDATTVVNAKELESIREGVEDYEYLAMLRDSIEAARARGVDSKLLSDAQGLLDQLPDAVLTPAGTETEWKAALDRTVADTARSSILDMLVRLSP
jgi:hypothetical protein